MDKIIRKINALAVALAGIFTVLLTALVTISVFCRYALNVPLFFSDEISGYFLLGIGCLALSHTMQIDRHIRVDLITSLLPTKANNFMLKILRLLFLFYSLILMIGGIVLFCSYYTRGTKSFTALEIPLMWPCLLVVFGTLLLVLEIAREISRGSD